MSEEWLCIRLLKATRYTDPGDIWRKLKGRGVEDTGTVTPSTSDDGKPDEESRLKVSNSLISSFFSISPLLPCLAKTRPSFHTPRDFWRFISNLSVFKPGMSDFVRLVGWQLQWYIFHLTISLYYLPHLPWLVFRAFQKYWQHIKKILWVTIFLIDICVQ